MISFRGGPDLDETMKGSISPLMQPIPMLYGMRQRFVHFVAKHRINTILIVFSPDSLASSAGDIPKIYSVSYLIPDY